MKVTKDQLKSIIALINDDLKSSCSQFENVGEYLQAFRQDLEEGRVKVVKCAATRALSCFVRGELLMYMCYELYPRGIKDAHLATAWRHIYNTH